MGRKKDEKMDREQLIDEIMNVTQRRHASRRGRKHSGESDSGRGMVLNYLYAHEGQTSPGELRDYMRVTTPRVTAVLNELEEDQLIVRETSSYDRRRVSVKLTDLGKQRVGRRRKEKREEIARLVDRLGTEDAEALLRICRVVEELEDESDCGDGA
ncbi:MAG: MarR family transcriptional regulator [Clostridiales bacterium]|nr:MarR family transcriptional regulator [Clostridiales bacterium]